MVNGGGFYQAFSARSIAILSKNVRRSAHGIQYLEQSYEMYRNRCLELWGIRYQDIEVHIDQRYNPIRLPIVEGDQSGGSKASNPASIEDAQGECNTDSKNLECKPCDDPQSDTQV